MRATTLSVRKEAILSDIGVISKVRPSVLLAFMQRITGKIGFAHVMGYNHCDDIVGADDEAFDMQFAHDGAGLLFGASAKEVLTKLDLVANSSPILSSTGPHAMMLNTCPYSMLLVPYNNRDCNVPAELWHHIHRSVMSQDGLAAKELIRLGVISDWESGEDCHILSKTQIDELDGAAILHPTYRQPDITAIRMPFRIFTISIMIWVEERQVEVGEEFEKAFDDGQIFIGEHAYGMSLDEEGFECLKKLAPDILSEMVSEESDASNWSGIVKHMIPQMDSAPVYVLK